MLFLSVLLKVVLQKISTTLLSFALVFIYITFYFFIYRNLYNNNISQLPENDILKEIVIIYNSYIKLVDGSQTASILELS